MSKPDVVYYEGCLICGVKKDLSRYPDCKSEAFKSGIELVDTIKLSEHIWTEMKEVKNWYGRGVLG